MNIGISSAVIVCY